jgi:hypothetical protein
MAKRLTHENDSITVNKNEGRKIAALTDALFWTGLGIILPAGFAASYPAMYWAIRRGQQQQGIMEKHNP